MADKPKPVDAMPGLRNEVRKLSSSNRLTSAVKNADELIELLTQAREDIASSPDLHATTLRITTLQNPIKDRFDKLNESLTKVSKVQKQLGKAIDKALPITEIPTDHDVMDEQNALINRAIAMHLLREGQFSVASTFIAEAKATTPHLWPSLDVYGDGGADQGSDYEEEDDGEEDQEMDTDGEEDVGQGPSGLRPSSRSQGAEAGKGTNGGRTATDELNISLRSQELQAKFADMYRILQALKQEDLHPAIEWARRFSAELEARGSNLEFELSKLQYVHLFQRVGPAAAHAYARQHMQRFSGRHLNEMQQLAAALVFAPNLAESPYAALFDSPTAFSDVSASFTREFCSLLGLSAESPLYVATTAGAIALPRLVKYMTAARTHGAEWTTTQELAFETPLPPSFMYHSIFVCPVSKEQTTAENPPVILPCGHVLARDSLHNMAKGPRFKCPYCPYEGQVKDARVVFM